MSDSRSTILQDVSTYYSDKLSQFGSTPQGVDWNGEEGQSLRFQQLSRIAEGDTGCFSVNDLGCGYGALLGYLQQQYPQQMQYHGYDVSADMVEAARKKFSADTSAEFVVADSPTVVADYGIASGIFNVRLQFDNTAWQTYVLKTLDTLDRTSCKGFSFNCLTAYSDADKKRDYLYYADPCFLFDYCKRHYSRHVALLHDYGLYEFTILVRKTL